MAIIPVLIKHITSATWIAYGECQDLSKVKRRPKVLVKHRGLIKGLLDIQTNGAFPQNVMTKAMHGHIKKKSEEWAMDEDHFDDIANTYALRIRAMLRHWTQAAGKNPQPRWMTDLGVEDEAEEEDAGEEGGEEEHAEGDEEEDASEEKEEKEDAEEKAKNDVLQETRKTTAKKPAAAPRRVAGGGGDVE